VAQPDIPTQSVATGLVQLSGGKFRMGAPESEGYAEDGEGLVRCVTISPFSMSKYTVTNREFAKFVEQTGYETTAEKLGWSHVFHLFLTPEQKRRTTAVPAETPWWYPVPEACWKAPEGPGSGLEDRQDHPVVHVSWFDAVAYCKWAGTTLPTEAQWEFAARAGSDLTFPWGTELTPNGEHMCNVWQGRFPGSNTADDGYVGTAPVAAFPPNKFGLHNMIGNVWEWCADSFSPDYHSITVEQDPLYEAETGVRSVRGGSFLCHASYCNRYRSGARNGNPPDTSCSNLGFRVSVTGLH
jgi:formylglycine-generating enzyme required for sulfatase activity